MKLLTLISGALGAGLTVWLLARFGLGHVLGLLHQAGWGIVLVLAFHLVQVWFSALAWRAIAGGSPGRPRLGDFVLLRWVREGVNSLLPVAQVGGEFVSARLLRRRGMSLASATACTVCDLTTEMVTQIAFTITGLLILLALLGRSQVTDEVVGAILLACMAALGFVAGQWLGLASLFERGLMRLAGQFGWQGMEEIAGLHRAIRTLYGAPGPLAAALLHQSISWLLGTFEVWLALHFLGHEVSVAAALVIESLCQAVKAAGFVVPGALGVSEGGYIVVGGLFGLSPQVSIALSLVKRLREIGLGLPALAAWQWLEHHWTATPAASQVPGSTPERGGRIKAALDYGDAP
ncbi:lysylphosphatidylglycerol synthase domain-containing protein [Lichenicoccus sp.]|uniref:lysylphosphatidylglycerol synthase domain-containing protein n=1 Tax=Lichenicoccus sp. TaxID=2781899 RepID=UPI003D0B3F22